MTNPIDHPFQPGVEVAIVSRGYGNDVSCRKAIVGKVYKNGNFTLEGGTAQQYRPSSTVWTGSREWCAFETGGGYRGSARIELLTDKLRAEVDATNRRSDFRKLVARLDRSSHSDVSQSHLDAIRRIADEIAPVTPTIPSEPAM